MKVDLSRVFESFLDETSLNLMIETVIGGDNGDGDTFVGCNWILAMCNVLKSSSMMMNVLNVYV